MYRDIQDALEINVVNDDGGLGDAIARLPAIKYIHDAHKHVTVNLWVQDFFKEYATHVFQDTGVKVHKFADIHTIQPHLARCFSVHRYTNLAGHLTDHAFHVIVNKDVDISSKNYLRPNFDAIDISEFKLPEKYVIMTSGFTAPAREFYPGYVNEVNNFIKANGYEIVFLGQTVTKTGVSHIIEGKFSDKIDYNAGLNFIDKTDLLEASKIIQGARAIVGLDNGLLHLAGGTDTAIVGGFTSVEPRYRLPYRRDTLGWNYFPVVPPEDLKCRFCQSNWTFTYKHDFKECYYKDYACVTKLKPELYIEQLKRVL